MNKLFFATALLTLTLPAVAADVPPASPPPNIVRLDVPYVPTPPFVVKAMLELAKVKPDDVLYDLGSGDGRIVIDAIRDRGLKHGVGIDLNPAQIVDADKNAKEAGVTDRAKFIVGDVFKEDFSAATVVTMYLLPNVNLRLRPKLLDDLHPGTRIVSHQFHMFDWAPDKQEKVLGEVPIYLWIIPAKLQGAWSGKSGDAAVSMTLEQKFQMVSGAVDMAGHKSTFNAGKIAGKTVTLEGDNGLKFDGTADGTTLKGTLHLDGVAHAIVLHR